MSPDGMPRGSAALAWAMAVTAGVGIGAGIVGMAVPGSVPWWAVLAPWLLETGFIALALLRVS